MSRAAIDADAGQGGTETTQFTIGVEVNCSDGVCGEVSRVVVDPIARAVTHLVVEPKHRQGLGRLVPLELVAATNGEIALSCTMADFDKLDPAEETQFLPGSDGYGSYGREQVYSWPYYGLGGAALGGSMGGGIGMAGGGLGTGIGSQTVTYDTVPLGEVAVRRGDPVHATDGDIGKVQGIVIDTRTHGVTHVLLQEGHLWGRKDVAIPIRAVTRVGEVIELNMTKQALEELPSIDVDHPEAREAEA
jgi:sporulation protein YlmC with PRC-barrel domain